MQPAESRGVEPVPVHQARGGDILFIDGNLDGLGVSFKHAEHEKREGGKESCVKCHHMNFPARRGDGLLALPLRHVRGDATPSGTTGTPRPTARGLPAISAIRAGRCAPPPRAVHCDKCHKNLVPAGATIKIKQYQAVAYTEAMHRMCIGCHIQKAKEKNKPEMTRCAWCHKENPEILNARDLILGRYGLSRSSVVMPPPNVGKN